MKKYNEVEQAIMSFNEGVDVILNTFKENNKIDVSNLKGESGMEILAGVVSNITTIVKAQYNNVTVPAFNVQTRFATNGDEITSVHIYLRASKDSVNEKAVVKVDADFIENVIGEIKAFAYNLKEREFAKENISEANEKLAAIAGENGTVLIQFALNDKFIADIDDSSITFGLKADATYPLADSKLFGNVEFEEKTFEEVVDYTEEEVAAMPEETREALVAERTAAVAEYNAAIAAYNIEKASHDFAVVGYTMALEKFIEQTKGKTPVQIISANIEFITSLFGKVNRRPDKMIRMSVSKQAKFMTNESVGYYTAEVEIGGEKQTIFSLLEKDSEGTVSVKLSPFNIETKLNVEYDVLANYDK